MRSKWVTPGNHTVPVLRHQDNDGTTKHQLDRFLA
jgi:hypothetical protein